MTGNLIRLTLTNLPVLLFAAAFVVAALLKQPVHFPTRLLNSAFALECRR